MYREEERRTVRTLGKRGVRDAMSLRRAKDVARGSWCCRDRLGTRRRLFGSLVPRFLSHVVSHSGADA